MDNSLTESYTSQAEKTKNKSSAYKIRPLNKASIMTNVTLAALFVLTIYGFYSFDYKDIDLSKASIDTLGNFKIMFTEPHFRHFDVREAFHQIAITLGLSVLTTIIGAVVALVLGLLSAENLSSPRVANTIKAIVSFIRAVPTVLWVLIFAVAAGLGSVAAVIGMAFHSISYLTKAFSESFEELDRGVIEALLGSGANWWQIVFQTVIPSSITNLISWTFMRFEINFAHAIAMGAAAGAGGIGFELYMASSHYFDLREVGLITYFILAIAILLEMISTRMKVKLKVNL